jgi:hypothetical protein
MTTMTKIWRKGSAEAQWLQANYKGRRPKDLAAEMTQRFGYTIKPSRVSYYLYHLGLKTGVGVPLLSKEQYHWLKDHCQGLTYMDQQKQVLDKFGVHLTLGQVKNMRSRWRMNSGLTGQYPKGNVPWSKGMKGLHIGGEATQFKKGQRSWNTKPAGYESIDQDGFVHFKPPGARKMTYKHRWVWEQAHGPIPPSHVLAFLDGDKTNCSLDNLILLPRGVHARMCQRHLYSDDPEKTKSGILVAKLLCKRYSRKKYKQWDNQRNWRRKP